MVLWRRFAPIMLLRADILEHILYKASNSMYVELEKNGTMMLRRRFAPIMLLRADILEHILYNASDSTFVEFIELDGKTNKFKL
jgi:hypothetical protein